MKSAFQRSRRQRALTARSRLALALMALSILATAGQVRAEETLIDVVQDFLHQQFADDDQVVIEVHLPAAKMPPCSAPQPFLPNRSRQAEGRVSVGVRCGEQGQQVRYLQAEINRYGQYPVLTREIAPGTQVTAAMLTQREGNLSELPREAVLEPASIIGQVARRALAAGIPLQQRQFEAKPLVRRGQQVSVEARGANFRVSREGKALDTGALGDSVRVQFGHRDLINARVVGEAKLVVDF
ncbi:MAG: flagellar basal body P-ring formation protein FlgA [Chromatiaceae bacterium]|nr:flagellar basal body P-ring formation protein FlgA [Chromatiaceae bacterium]MCF8014108.1 flagellar basal body P-ring formation protein FlgA [Chromatiaceae bacterium]